MKARLLAGNSLRNEGWIEEIWENLEDLFDEIKIHNYEHWDTGAPMMDFDFEMGELAKVFWKKEGVIFAKSLGIALALKAISEGKIKPEKCIFVGTPVLFCEANSIPLKKWITEFDIPTLFMQNDEDPAIDADELHDYLRENNVKNYDFWQLDGESHDYLDFERMRGLIEEFLNKK